MQTRKAKRKDPVLQSDYAKDVLSAILSDCFNSLPLYRYADYARDLATIHRRIDHEGISFATGALTCLSQGLFNLKEGRPASFPGFSLRNGYPIFLGSLFRNAIEGLKQDRASYVAAIYQISVAFKKLRGGYKRSQLQAQWETFVQVDEQLLGIDWFDDSLFPILERARYLCKQFCADIDIYSHDFIPRPGPGATNTPTKPWERYEPHTRFKKIGDVMPYADWFYPSRHSVFNRARYYQRMKHAIEPESRFKFVPKTAGKARGICIEENEVQFLQQAIRRGITRSIERHSLYKRRITLNDQSNNQWLALDSSSSRRYSTIDMSDASDRIARELVSWIFQDNEELHDVLMCLSTRVIVPPKEVKSKGKMRTAKYAPMGSGLCFPIMSLVHMFLIRAMIQLSDAKYPHHLSTQVWVYGDDIVIPSSVFRLVCDVLPKFGMKINETKSFVTSHFRESCGVHAYDGVDVTPVFIRDLPRRADTKSIVSSIETEYQLWSKGWMQTAKVLRQYAKIADRRLSVRAFVAPTSDVVAFKRAVDYPWLSEILGRRVRFNHNEHNFERKVLVFHSKTIRASILNPTSAYMRQICHGSNDITLQRMSEESDPWSTIAADGGCAHLCTTADPGLNLGTRHTWRTLSSMRN